MITIFTPTYNRAYIIDKLYRSLQSQTCFDFEWLVVDDGSSDNTRELFDAWQKESNSFVIRYYYQQNGGKHRAINRALRLAKGNLFFLVDSDDWLLPDSVQRVFHWVSSLPDDQLQRYCGVCGQRVFPTGQLMGNTFLGDWIDCTCLERDKYGISGDKAEVIFTDIMRRYPFPEIEEEKFITEAIVWDQIASDGYLFRFFNEPIYMGEYREDGLTNQGLDLFMRNPKGFALYLKQCKQYGKYEHGLQNFFEVHCYLACRKVMALPDVSRLMERPALALVMNVAIYQIRQLASRIKHLFLNAIWRKQ